MYLHAEHASSGLWTHWLEEPASAITLAALTATYAVGTLRVWRQAGVGHGIRRWQVAAFAAGVTTLAIALLSPIGALAEALFWMHMVQHVLLAVIAPPFLVAGAPIVAALWVLPSSPRRRALLAVRRQRWLVRAWYGVTQPLVACGIHAVALWVWHWPALYVAALTHPAVHVLEHTSFVGTAVLLWWAIIHPRSSRRDGYALGVVALFLTTLQSGALGALLSLSNHVLFPAQSAALARGITPLEDQQLAGLVMWVPAGILYMLAMAVVFRAWMRTLQPAAV